MAADVEEGAAVASIAALRTYHRKLSLLQLGNLGGWKKRTCGRTLAKVQTHAGNI